MHLGLGYIQIDYKPNISISSFSLHFLFIFSISLHFLAAGLPQVVQPWLTLKYKYLLMTTFCLGVTQHDVLPFLSSASRHDSQFQTYFNQFHTISI